jgi:hypothetical protein
MEDNLEKAKILKESLKIVDELATYSFEDEDDLIHSFNDLYKLVRKAKDLKRSKYWKLR